jgi:hypothetical protein
VGGVKTIIPSLQGVIPYSESFEHQAMKSNARGLEKLSRVGDAGCDHLGRISG